MDAFGGPKRFSLQHTIRVGVGVYFQQCRTRTRSRSVGQFHDASHAFLVSSKSTWVVIFVLVNVALVLFVLAMCVFFKAHRDVAGNDGAENEVLRRFDMVGWRRTLS